MRTVLKIIIIYVAGFVFLITCLFLLVMGFTIASRLTKPKIHEVTTPLEAIVVQNLCQKFSLPEDDPLCRPEAIVYAPDFFPAVRAAFTPGITTYDDVQEKLGSYQYERKPLVTQAGGTTYFRCRYDFNGDRVFPVGFSFTEDGVLKRIFATVGDD